MTSKTSRIAGWVVAIMLSGGGMSWAAQVNLETMDLTGVHTGWGEVMKDRSVSGQALRVAGQGFSRGIGVHAPSLWEIELDGQADVFRAKVGVDAQRSSTPGTVMFKVLGDGKELWTSQLMTSRTPAKPCEVALNGIHKLRLVVEDAGDGLDSDHADWLEPVIDYHGVAPVARAARIGKDLQVDHADAPPNVGLRLERQGDRLVCKYREQVLFEAAALDGISWDEKQVTGSHGEITQVLRMKGVPQSWLATVHGSHEAIAAETKGSAQVSFPLVRTAHGPSTNLRNNAIYDRTGDWLLEVKSPVVIKPLANGYGQKSCHFQLTMSEGEVELVFCPRYYQKHRNLRFYEPWTYRVRKDSITGWSSWWAYLRNYNEKTNAELLRVWEEKRFADYGYRFVQIDDVYQGRYDGERKHSSRMSGYPGGYPDTWLDWRTDRFPSGMDGYVKSVKKAGFSPAIWMGCFFSPTDAPQQHPEWFVQGKDGKPSEANWVSHVVDTTQSEAVEKLIRPTFRGLKHAGIEYVKIDQLRHMLYDNLHQQTEWFSKRGIDPALVLRNYLKIAREELGEEVFILACWGVLPEAIGLADACRIGGDGYGPVTMQQYNSFNGLVWRNDPDHVDVLPKKAAAEAGNVTKFADAKAVANDTLIRPALASIAGAMLMLSDSPSVYQSEENLRGLRKSSPVIFSVPGQLYDYDSKKSDVLKNTERTKIRSGASPAPVDADQFGTVCPYWLNEFDKGFEHWSVLHRLNWQRSNMKSERISLENLGLDARKTYLVYEFWSNRYLGSIQGNFEACELAPMGLQSFAIREQLDRPQVVSTSRHLSQGAAELEQLTWDSSQLVLEGRSYVVAEDDYQVSIRVPSGYRVKQATVDRVAVTMREVGELVVLTIHRSNTASTGWAVTFEKK